jgi:hypothetical protein
LPAISLASSFQRRQPHPVSITLDPTNPHRTFASTKFRRTSGETEHFRCKGTPPWSFHRRALRRDGRSRESDVDSVIFPNSGDSATPASSSVAVVHLWPKVSTPSRSSRRFLSVLPFNLQFRGHPHRIPFTLPAPMTCGTKAPPLVSPICRLS